MFSSQTSVILSKAGDGAYVAKGGCALQRGLCVAGGMHGGGACSGRYGSALAVIFSVAVKAPFPTPLTYILGFFIQ